VVVGLEKTAQIDFRNFQAGILVGGSAFGQKTPVAV